jgi:hypothetical protein
MSRANARSVVRCLTVIFCIFLGTKGVLAQREARWRSVDDVQPHSGKLLALTRDTASFQSVDGEVHDVLRKNLWWIEAVSRDESAAGRIGHLLVLTNRDRLLCEAFTVKDGVLTITRANAPSVIVPLEYALGIVLRANADQRFEPLLLRQTFEADTLLLANGDRVAGELAAVEEGMCRIRTAAAELSVDLDQLSAIALQSDLALPIPHEPRHATLVLRDGSLLTASGVERNDSAMRVDAEADFMLQIPWSEIQRVDFYGERVIPMTDLPQPEFAFTPFLDRPAGFEMNRNAYAGLLRMRGQTFARGIGAAPRARFTWKLPAGAARFYAEVGIDDASGASGNADVIVEMDGREVFRREDLSGGETPAAIGPIELRDGGTLSFFTDFGAAADIGDLADWARPVILK